MHYGFMCWSYIGLVAAAAAETLVRVPRSPFWGTVAVSSAAVMFVGGWLVNRLQARTLGRICTEVLVERVSEASDTDAVQP